MRKAEGERPAAQELTWRAAVPEDIQALCALRQKQLIDEGIPPAADLSGELPRFFRRMFAAGAGGAGPRPAGERDPAAGGHGGAAGGFPAGPAGL